MSHMSLKRERSEDVLDDVRAAPSDRSCAEYTPIVYKTPLADPDRHVPRDTLPDWIDEPVSEPNEDMKVFVSVLHVLHFGNPWEAKELQPKIVLTGNLESGGSVTLIDPRPRFTFYAEPMTDMVDKDEVVSYLEYKLEISIYTHEWVERITSEGYSAPRRMIKLSVKNRKCMQICDNLLSSGFYIDNERVKFKTYNTGYEQTLSARWQDENKEVFCMNSWVHVTGTRANPITWKGNDWNIVTMELLETDMQPRLPIVAWDIEVCAMPETPERRGDKPPFPTPDRSPVTHISFGVKYDIMSQDPYDEITCLAIGPVEGLKKPEFEVIWVSNEPVLLALTFAGFARIGVRILTGWNQDIFDGPYTKMRTDMLFETADELAWYLKWLHEVTDEPVLNQSVEVLATCTFGGLVDKCQTYITNDPVALLQLKDKVNPFLLEFQDKLRRRTAWRREYVRLGILPDNDNIWLDGAAAEAIDHILPQIPQWEQRLNKARGSYRDALLSLLSYYSDGYVRVNDKGVFAKGKNFWNRVSNRLQPAWKAFGSTEAYQSKARGKSMTARVWMSCNVWDAMAAAKLSENMNSYGLKSFYQAVFGKHTFELPYDHLPGMWLGAILCALYHPSDGSECDHCLRGNTVEAHYNFKDVVAVFEVLLEFGWDARDIAFGSMSGTPMGKMLGGQLAKVWPEVIHEARLSNCVFAKPGKVVKKGTYDGALVVPPEKGLYMAAILMMWMLIACIDFGSLYPSIAQLFNLCFTTTIQLEGRTVEEVAAEHGLEPHQYFIAKSGGFITVKEEVRRGIIPRMCTQCKSRRNEWKARKKAHDKAASWDDDEYEDLCDKFRIQRAKNKEARKRYHGNMKKVADKRQLAIKLTQNSYYGFLGALLKFRHLAREITKLGMLLNMFAGVVFFDTGRKGSEAIPFTWLRARLALLYDFFASVTYPRTRQLPNDVPCPWGLDELTYDQIWELTEKRSKVLFEDFYKYYNRKHDQATKKKEMENMSKAFCSVQRQKENAKNRRTKAAAGTRRFDANCNLTDDDGSRKSHRPTRAYRDEEAPPLFIRMSIDAPGTGMLRLALWGVLWCSIGKTASIDIWMDGTDLSKEELARELWAQQTDGLDEGFLERLEPPATYGEDQQVIYGDTDSLYMGMWDAVLNEIKSLPSFIIRHRDEIYSFVKEVPHNQGVDPLLILLRRAVAHVVFTKSELASNIFFSWGGKKLVEEFESLTDTACFVRHKGNMQRVCKPRSLDTEPEVKVTGLQQKRRDNSGWRMNVLNKVQDCILNADLEGSITSLDKAAKTIAEIPLHQFALTKSYSKPVGEYKKPCAQTEIVNRALVKYNEVIPVGTRLEMVACKTSIMDVKDYQRWFTIGEMIEENMVVDLDFYIERLHNPIMAMFGYSPPAVLERVKKIFSDARTGHKIKQNVPADSRLLAFGFTRLIKCEVCGETADEPICSKPECQAQRPELLERDVAILEKELKAQEEVWRVCYECPAVVNDGIDPVNCGATWCSNNTTRSMVDKNVERTRRHIEILRAQGVVVVGDLVERLQQLDINDW